MPVPTISPSPWSAWPSPRWKSAPGDEDGEVDGDARAKAAVVHVAAVLGRRSRVEIACPRGRRDAEAAEHRVERQPPSDSRPGGGSSSRAVPRSRSMRPSRRSRRARGSSRTNAGSTTFGATSGPVKPLARFGRMRSKRTASVSPGSAPSTKNGPVCGLPPSVMSLPSAVVAARVDAPGRDRVAARDAQHGLVRRRSSCGSASARSRASPCASTSARSLSPRPERQTRTSSSSRSRARASACAGSSAGMIPSVAARRAERGERLVVGRASRTRRGPLSRRNACSGPTPG